MHFCTLTLWNWDTWVKQKGATSYKLKLSPVCSKPRKTCTFPMLFCPQVQHNFNSIFKLPFLLTPMPIPCLTMTIQAQVQTQTTRNSQCASLTAQQRSSLTPVQCSTTFSTSAHPASFCCPIGAGAESINTNQAQRLCTPCANSEASHNNEANHTNSHSTLKSIP